MLVQFGNNGIQKIPLTAKLDSACGLVQFWLSSKFFSSNYFQIGQHVVLLHIQTLIETRKNVKNFENEIVPKILVLTCKKKTPNSHTGRNFAHPHFHGVDMEFLS